MQGFRRSVHAPPLPELLTIGRVYVIAELEVARMRVKARTTMQVLKECIVHLTNS